MAKFEIEKVASALSLTTEAVRPNRATLGAKPYWQVGKFFYTTTKFYDPGSLAPWQGNWGPLEDDVLVAMAPPERKAAEEKPSNKVRKRIGFHRYESARKEALHSISLRLGRR